MRSRMDQTLASNPRQEAGRQPHWYDQRAKLTAQVARYFDLSCVIAPLGCSASLGKEAERSVHSFIRFSFDEVHIWEVPGVHYFMSSSSVQALNRSASHFQSKRMSLRSIE